MAEPGLLPALQFRDNALGQSLAYLDAPLVERVDAPDGPLGEDDVLVKGHEFAQRFRGKALGEDRVGGAVALEDPVGHEPIRRALGFYLLGRLAESQRFTLGKDIGQEDVMVPAQGVKRLAEGDEVTGDKPGSLMNQLVERVLAVSPRLAPIDGTSLVGDLGPIQGDVLSVALHGELLQIGRESLQILLVRQDRHGLGAEEVVVPDGQEAHKHRQVARERGGAEVLVHLMEAVQHGPEVVRADGQHGGEADGRVQGVASADPVPELEHVGGIDAELRHSLSVRRDRDKMPGHRFFVVPETRQRPVAGRVGVGHRLQRGKGFGRNDEEGFRGIKILDRLREVGAIDIGNETERHGALAVVLERLVGHHRPQIGAPDADIDDVPNTLAGVAQPSAAPDAAGKVSHLVQHGVDLGHHVLAVHDDDCSLRGTQGYVQDGSFLRKVDLFSPEHGVNPSSQAGFLG